MSEREIRALLHELDERDKEIALARAREEALAKARGGLRGR
jgi:hypothetical protein